MINTEAVDCMLEELDRCQKKISTLERNMLLVECAQLDDLPYADEVIEMLEQLLKREKAATRFIHDLLAFEYEHLEVSPILKQLHI